MGWSSDEHFRTAKKAPPCWACRHYEAEPTEDGGRQLLPVMAALPPSLAVVRHRCHIARPEFPYAGPRCRAYIYEPGADGKEAYL